MSFRDIDLNISYISYSDNDNIANMINKLLSESVFYSRSVGYFSSSVLNFTKEGILKLVKNNGKIKILASPNISQDDILAISMGYKSRQLIYKESFLKEFEESLNELKDENLQLIYELITKGYLDIKIIKTKGSGIYHDKVGLFEDLSGNKVVFFGSSNDTANGLAYNYEKVRMAFSWDDTKRYVDDEINDFNALWDDVNKYNDTYDFMDAVKDKVLEVKEKRENIRKTIITKPIITPRKYQEEAILAWKNNNYNGFFLMATGTGKTYTTIFGIKELIKEEEKLFIVIAAPYIHLLAQWKYDLLKIINEVDLVLVSSENNNWREDLKKAVYRQEANLSNSKVICAISTIKSFFSNDFNSTLDSSTAKKLFICDEAHRLYSSLSRINKDKFHYKLGLSATPYSGNNRTSGQELMDFFGGQVYSLDLDEAIDGNFLVHYRYHPIFVNASYDEQEDFNHKTKLMASCFKNGILCVPVKRLAELKRSRLRILSNAQEKINNIVEIIKKTQSDDHLIVYCGDGKLDEQTRMLQFIKMKLNDLNIKTAQFTCQENMEERLNRIESFNDGYISAMVAIKCLDEGINIPSIKTALILSSNDDPREFIQRRGRILRTYTDKDGVKKTLADIYDVVVMPYDNCPNMAKIELRRFKEYNKLADNFNENDKLLQKLCHQYNIDYSELNFLSYEDNIEYEGDMDE